jgi:integrase
MGDGAVRMTCQYLIQRGQTFSYRRGVPTDLRQFYPGPFIVVALKTKDKKTAMLKAEAVNTATERQWDDLRDPEKTIYAQASLNLPSKLSYAELFAEGQRAAMLYNLDQWEAEQYRKMHPVEVAPTPEPQTDRTMMKALELYLHLHDNGQKPRFIYTTSMPVKRAVELIGDKPLPDWSRKDTRDVQDMFLKDLKTKTVRVYINTISAVVNRAIHEWELTCRNNFSALDIKNEGKDAKVVEDYTLQELETIAAASKAKDDDIAWAVGLQLALGARISEVVQLRAEDIFLDAAIPYVKLCAHQDLGQAHKTDEASRDVPLTGLGIWAARRALMNSQGHKGWLFRFGLSKGQGQRLINLWLKELLHGTVKRSHSFRHSLQTRLARAGVLEGIICQIIGHADKGKSAVSAGYFHGYELAQLRDALNLVAIPAASA